MRIKKELLLENHLGKLSSWIYASIISFLCINCQGKSEGKVHLIEGDLGVDSTFVCTLQENLTTLMPVSDVTFLDDTTFYVLSGDEIVKYGISGTQLQVIRHKGQGPGEYISAESIESKNPMLYVWDSGTLKLMRYDRDGNFISEITGFSTAIEDFKIYNKDLVIFYNSGGANDLMDVYDIDNHRFLAHIGKLSQEDKVLQLLSVESRLTVKGDYIYYVYPSSSTIYRFAMGEYEEEMYRQIPDPEFTVARVEDATALINKNRNETLKYLGENSLTTTLIPLEDRFLVGTNVGQFELTMNQAKPEMNQRFAKWYHVTQEPSGGVATVKLPATSYSRHCVHDDGSTMAIVYDVETETHRMMRLSPKVLP